MLSTLNITPDKTHCGNIGHAVKNFHESCLLAKQYGFQQVNYDLVTDPSTVADIQSALNETQVQIACFGFTPKIFEADNTIYEESLKQFEDALPKAAELNLNIALAYLPPFTEQLPFHELFQLSASRLKLIKPLLEQYNLKIGFEFIGSTEPRQQASYDFIHTIDGVRCLIAAADIVAHGGFKLDIHHWQYSGATWVDLQHLRPDEILYVELSDSNLDYSYDSMPEFDRELPFTNGNTAIELFLKQLKRKNYQGPVAIETFNKNIASMSLNQALSITQQSMNKVMDYYRSI